MYRIMKGYSVLLAVPMLAGKMSETAPETPVMDLTWWGWLLVVFVSIVVVGLAMAWQARHGEAMQGGHGDEGAGH